VLIPDGFTAAQVKALLEADEIEFDARLERVDFDLVWQADLTDHFEPDGSSVTWTARTGVHRSCTLQLTTELDWATSLVRPITIARAGGLELEVVRGTFLLHRVDRQASDADPDTIPAQGLDRLELLNTEPGRTVRVAAGVSYLQAAIDLIVEIDPATDPAALILADQTNAGVLLDADRVWEASRRHTYLAIVNGLLLAAGYRAVWADHLGRYRLDLYQTAALRPPEWTYDTTDEATTIVHPERSESAAWWDVPNEWVFVRNRPAAGVAGTTDDGTDGRLVVTNQSDGPTSIDQRGGVVRRRTVSVDAATAEALAAQAADVVADDSQVVRARRLTVDPNPLHGHLDVVQVIDEELGTGKALITDWTAPMTDEPMLLTAEMV
jgi:hypothetical protein